MKFNKEREVKLRKIMTHYGEFNQLGKLHEELGELRGAIANYFEAIAAEAKKAIDSKTNTLIVVSDELADNLIEEAADVAIMLEQFILFQKDKKEQFPQQLKQYANAYDILQETIDEKLDRTLKRIEKKERKSKK